MLTSKDLKQQLLVGYDESLSHSGINGERLAQRLHELAQIGMTHEYGSNRIGFSTEERKAKDFIKSWMVEANLKVREDGAGNIIGRLEGRLKDSAAILSGSHVDSVPNGGHFDGPLGVLVALEVAQAWQDQGYLPELPYEVVVFSDEEGSRFNGGLTGSQAMMGELDFDKLHTLYDIHGVPFKEVMEQAGLRVDSLKQAKRDVSEIKAFIEVHIEQGKLLEKEGLTLGVVTGIAGPSWMNVTFTGQAGHAGNTPMTDRKDALVAAGQFIAGLKDLPQTVSSTAVATVGKLQVYPNGVNVIPGEVQLTVDIRDVDLEARDELVQRVLRLGEGIAKQGNISFSAFETLKIDPVPMNEGMQNTLHAAIQDLAKSTPILAPALIEQSKETPFSLISGAGHDAMILGKHVPTAMLFVRSKEGISHNPREWTSLNDCMISAHALKACIERMMVI
ncbi:Zn-dependent hydrolase [Caldalkalibacillus horti]|uniref:Allantoate deiminase n=1 Tax=Caldalkalibacillus horti TaxID=77523 RepID=A0ABT9W020_9BACI|nr:allantoate deiminase [Bacillus horti]